MQDQTAIDILQTIVRSQLTPARANLPSDTEAIQALTEVFGNQPEPTASEGDLARAALALLSEDPAITEPIRLMADQPSTESRPQTYIEPATIAVTTAVLLALQTRIKFKADQSGKWSIEVDKKAGSDAALKLVVQRLLSFLTR